MTGVDVAALRAREGIAAVIRYNAPEPCHDPQCPASRDEFDPMDIARRIIEGPAQTLIRAALAEAERRRDEALALCASFDPTSGPGRARAFVGDLRAALTGPRPPTARGARRGD